jgi:Protein of unknown function (DUF1552)
MSFITKKHISRRTLLRGTGVALALPLLESMVPAQTPIARTAAAGKLRFTGIFVPHGMAPGYWMPEGPTLGDKLPTILESLAPVKNQTVVISGLWAKSAEPPPGVTGADHWVAAAFMAADKPKKTTGADIDVDTTIDQIIARKIGQDSLVPSLQLGLEDPGANSSNCGEGYSCAYTNSISWASPTQPLPMELNPQVVFERLFGDGGSKEERALRREQDRSILDSVTKTLARFKQDVSADDKRKLDEYTETVREIERRLQIAKKASGDITTEGVIVPAGVPESFDEHVKLHSDLNVLAFQADITRVSSYLYARDLTSRNYPASGTNTGFHGGSHHAENPDRIKDYSLINKYHVSCMSYLAQKMSKTPDGDGTLLDHSLILYGTNMGNSNQHLHFDVPHLLVGGAGKQLKGGRHLSNPTKTVSTANVLASILNMYGIPIDKFGDGDGVLKGLV